MNPDTPSVLRRAARGVTLAGLAALAGCASRSEDVLARFPQAAAPPDGLVAVEAEVAAPAGGPGREESRIIPEYVEWWEEQDDLTYADGSLRIGLGDAFGRALRNSNQIRVFSDLPLVRGTSVAEAEAVFTPRFFAEGKYERLNEPVGSTLQTGGPDRFREESVVGEVGVTKRLGTGADVTVSQRVENVDNNSVFFVPNPQSRAKLVVGAVQPLLQGAGTTYNEGIIEIARIDGRVARAELVRQVESHLSEVARAYWNLYLARATERQQTRLADRTAEVVRRLEGRGRLDASGRLLLRARSELSRRQSDLVRRESAVRNAEDRLRSLLNDRELFTSAVADILVDSGGSGPAPGEDLEAQVEAALRDRPEVRQAVLQLEAAGVREDMARNEALPRLDAIAEAHVAGLDGGDDVGDPLGKQFSEGGVSYLVGLRFETPLGTGPEQVRLRRRRLERLQQANQLAVTLDTVRLEARVSAREVRTAWRELEARRRSLADAREDLRLLTDRFDQGLGRGDGGDAAATSFLEFLLDSQERVARSEGEYAEAVAAYRVSLVNLERVKGSLLRYEEVDARPIFRRDAREGLGLVEIRPRPLAPTTRPAIAVTDAAPIE